MYMYMYMCLYLVRPKMFDSISTHVVRESLFGTLNLKNNKAVIHKMCVHTDMYMIKVETLN